jgi:NmrA-like family
MSKLLTVVGGTGTQGLSLINAALEEGSSYKIRALTRNPSSEKAKALVSRGVEVVQADINSEESLVKAFAGSHAIYAITDFFEPFAANGPEKAIEIESAQGINLARAASKTSTLEHYIWSTLPNGSRLTNGKFQIPHFAAKNKVDDYIRSDKALFAKTTFLWITWYANNYQYPMFTPIYVVSSLELPFLMYCDLLILTDELEIGRPVHPTLASQTRHTHKVHWRYSVQRWRIHACNTQAALQNFAGPLCDRVQRGNDHGENAGGLGGSHGE